MARAWGEGLTAVDTHLAAVHFRVEMAGIAAEEAIEALKTRRIFMGRVRTMAVAGHLQHAVDYLRESGGYPSLLGYVEQLRVFYAAEASKILRPTEATKVAAALYANQGNLVAADPLLPLGAAKA